MFKTEVQAQAKQVVSLQSFGKYTGKLEISVKLGMRMTTPKITFFNLKPTVALENLPQISQLFNFDLLEKSL